MNCSRPDLREKLELYVLKQLPPDLMKAVERHLLECDECSDNFQQQVPLAGAIDHEEREKMRRGDPHAAAMSHGGHDPHDAGGHGAPAQEPAGPPPAGWAVAAIAAFIAFAIVVLAVIADSRRFPNPAGESHAEGEK